MKSSVLKDGHFPVFWLKVTGCGTSGSSWTIKSVTPKKEEAEEVRKWG
jgi:hypothetical protein